MFKVLCPVLLLAACSAAPVGVSTVDQKQVSTHMSESSPKPDKAAAPAQDDAMAPARDGNIAIMEEFEAAQKQNTTAAYDLFIARNPNHELALKAKSLRLQAQK